MPEIDLEPEVQTTLQNQFEVHSLKRQAVPWTLLPYELWLTILVDYGLTAKDLLHLDYTCKWFGSSGIAITEESARLIIKRRKKDMFGNMINKLLQHSTSWKRTLHDLERIESSMQQIAAGSYQNIFATKAHLLTWGAGKFGQLGNGRWEDSVQMQDIGSLVPAESGSPVQVSAGCGHSGFITTRGHAFTCGDNRYSQLGHFNSRGQTCAVPTRVCKQLSNRKCLQIACGSSHTLFLTDTGTVYVTGLGDSGQLGLGTRKAIAQDPTLIPFQYDDYTIVQITAGIAHNIFITSCGKAFSFGLGSTGQLGHGGTKDIPTPTLVSVLRDRVVQYAAAGVSHSIFLDAKGVAYTCGKGDGLLGHGETKIRTVPHQVAKLQGVKVVSAAAGVTQSIFISAEGTGYWCGEGMGNLKHHTATLPTKMELPEPLVRASIGNSHTVLLMKSGLLMSMGSNGRFQTGIATPQDNAPIINYTYIH